jgi:hypothetical protein
MTIRWRDERRPRWDEGGREAFKADCAWNDAHPGRVLIFFGRCRSGRRWFWAAQLFEDCDEALYGWTDTEDEALTAARAAVERLTAGQDAVACLTQSTATYQLKEVNKAKRTARLTARPSSAKDSKTIEYLYGHTRGGEVSEGHPVRFRITKKTAKRIFYLQWGEVIDTSGEPVPGYEEMRSWMKDKVGFVDRQELETKGEVYNYGRHWCDSDFHLYTSLQGLLSRFARYNEDKDQPDLRQLKAEMAAAHPDRGGSNLAFIEARKRYIEARARLGRSAQ